MAKKKEYPNVALWNTNIAPEDHLTIINEGDFPKKEILKGLGIEMSGLVKSFGITDPDEIQNRLALSNFLMKNPALRKRIKSIKESGIPLNGSDFLSYFHKDRVHNPHWKQIHSFLEGIKRAKIALPSRLVRVVGELKSRLGMEDDERKLGTEVSELLEKSTVIEGRVTLEMDGNSSNDVNGIKDEKGERRKVSRIHGHRHHSAALSRVRARDYEEWDKSELKTLCLVWLFKNTIALLANFYRRCSMKTMTIKDIDGEMMQEIIDVVNDKLKNINMYDVLSGLPRRVKRIYLDVYFCYNKAGLQIRIDAIRPEASDEEDITELQCGIYEGYSNSRTRRIERLQKRINRDRKMASQYLLAGLLYRDLLNEDTDFFNLKEYKSPTMDNEFKWFAMEKAIKAGDFRARFDEIMEHRDFFYEHMTIMSQLCEIIESMQRKARSLKTKLCIPEILQDSKQTLIMNGIYPIHLFARDDVKPRPIRGIEEINGEMVSLTGENAAGKTVTELAFTDNIWVAQSGLPVFGGGLSLTIKKNIGLVFLERGDGSTCELLMRKIKNLLSHLESNGGADTLYIVDELGTGTSGDFIEIGKQILRKLHNSQASVIFSTQIRSLAEYAEKEFKTRCLQLDRTTHEISEGIGDANPQGLADSVGLSALLK